MTSLLSQLFSPARSGRTRESVPSQRSGPVGTFATSLQTRFLMIGVTSVLAIVVAFVGFIEIRQYSAAQKYIEVKVDRIMDSGIILFADAASRRDEEDLLHLMAPILGDPDVIATAIEFADGTPPITFGEPLTAVPENRILRRSILHPGDISPTAVATFAVAISHDRIEQELIERLWYDVLLAFVILLAIIVTTYQSLRVTVMRPLNRLLRGIESRRALEDYRAVDWEKDDEFGQVIDAFNDMQVNHLRYQQELRMARDAAEGADRAKTAFLAIVGHELRTPLNSIIEFSEVLEAGLRNTPEEEFARYIREGGTALLELIRDVMETTQAEAGTLDIASRPLTLAPLVEETVQTAVSERDEESASVAVDISADLPVLYSDPGRLPRILLHLLRNALTHTPADGEVRVAVRHENGDIRIEVADTESGIPAERLDALQQPFAKLSEDWTHHRSGIGLGVSYVGSITRALGGSFTLASTLGAGTTATLIFTV
jgi:signal transduction histidine kinase